MKNIAFLIVLVAFFGCQSPDDDLDKNRSIAYTLHRANFNPTNGEVVFSEKAAGVLEVRIELRNTDKEIMHPAHLHFGSVREVGELAIRLNPVDGSTGESVTLLEHVELPDGRLLDFESLQTMDGSVKIHMNDNYFKHMVLAFGNVGKNEDYLFDGVAVCTGH